MKNKPSGCELLYNRISNSSLKLSWPFLNDWPIMVMDIIMFSSQYYWKCDLQRIRTALICQQETAVHLKIELYVRYVFRNPNDSRIKIVFYKQPNAGRTVLIWLQDAVAATKNRIFERINLNAYLTIFEF